MECFQNKGGFRNGPGVALILGFVLLGIGALAEEATDSGSSPWSFSIGFKRRYNIDTDIRGGKSYSAGQFGPIGGPSSAIAGVGTLDATADRDYDDGYVYRDIGTDVGGPRQGLTWNYEYIEASQFDPAADTLSFTKTAADPYAGDSSSAFREFENDNNGIQLRLSRLLLEKERFRLSAVFDVSYFPEKSNRANWSDYSARFATVTDTYGLQGVDPSVRLNPDLDGDLYGAPSSGNDPRPVIDNVPTGREVSDLVYGNNVAYRMDYDIATVGAGMEAEWAVHDRVSLYVSPRIERYRMDIDTWRTETLTDAAGAVAGRWNDHVSDHEYFWGAVLEGGVQVALTDRWFVRLHGDALKTWDDVGVQTGPTVQAMDLSGWSWGCDLGVRF